MAQEESARERIRQLIDSAPAHDHATLHLPYAGDHSRTATIYANQNGVIFWANLAARTLLGYSFDELVGAPVSRLIPARLAAAHDAAFARRVAEELAQPVANQRVKDTELLAVALHRDGSELPVRIRLTSYRHNGSITFAASLEVE